MHDNVIDTLRELGYNLTRVGNIYQTNAVYRNGDGKKSIAIYPETDSYYDFVACRGGSLFNLIHITLNNTKYSETKGWLHNKNINFNKKVEYKIPVIHQKIYKEESLLRLQKDNSYWINRGISEKTLNELEGSGIGLRDVFKGRYVFPIRNHKGRIVGFAGRLLKSELNSYDIKWKLHGEKKYWDYPYYYNKDLIKQGQEVLLVESIGDLLTLWDKNIKNVFCCFGTIVLKGVLSKIISLNPSKIHICFNNDLNKKENYGLINAEKEKIKLTKFFDSDSIKISPPFSGDFNEMSNEDFEKWKTTKQIT